MTVPNRATKDSDNETGANLAKLTMTGGGDGGGSSDNENKQKDEDKDKHGTESETFLSAGIVSSVPVVGDGNSEDIVYPPGSRNKSSSSNGSNNNEDILWCGCCCNLRLLCIVFGFIYICFQPFIIFLHLDGHESFRKHFTEEAGHDESGDGLDVLGITKNACSIVFASIGVLGAVRFQRSMVLCAAVWYGVDLVASTILFKVIGAVVAAALGYAHFFLFRALRNGTIRKQDDRQQQQQPQQDRDAEDG